MMQDIDMFFLGCSMAVSVVDEHATELHDVVKSDQFTPPIGRLWRNDDMKDLLSQIRGYHNQLIHLLQIFKTYVDFPVMLSASRH